MAIVNGSLQEGYKDAAWFAANPTLVLLVGQKVNLEQTGTYKLGDGTTQLSALSFLGASGGNQSLQDVITVSPTVNGIIAESNDANTNIFVDNTKVRIYSSDGNTEENYIEVTPLGTNISSTSSVGVSTPSLTKNGVEVATLNDIPSVAGLAPIASPTFTGIPTAPTASAGNNSTQIATTAYVDGKSLFRTTTDSSTHTGTLTNTIIWSEDISNKLSSGDIADLISDVVRVSGSTSATIRYYLNSSASLSGATQIGLYYYGFSGLNIADFRRQLIVKSSTVIRVKGSVSGPLNDYSVFSNYADVTVNLASLHVIFAITLGNTGDQFLVSSRKMVR